VREGADAKLSLKNKNLKNTRNYVKSLFEIGRWCTCCSEYHIIKMLDIMYLAADFFVSARDVIV